MREGYGDGSGCFGCAAESVRVHISELPDLSGDCYEFYGGIDSQPDWSDDDEEEGCYARSTFRMNTAATAVALVRCAAAPVSVVFSGTWGCVGCAGFVEFCS